MESHARLEVQSECPPDGVRSCGVGSESGGDHGAATGRAGMSLAMAISMTGDLILPMVPR
jgi:hypothetical protein